MKSITAGSVAFVVFGLGLSAAIWLSGYENSGAGWLAGFSTGCGCFMCYVDALLARLKRDLEEPWK